MSDPVLVQFTFQIQKTMPKDMKKLILYLFTDYYDFYYNNKKPSDKEISSLRRKYPEIDNLYRNDCYHNIGLQECHLEEWDVYDLDTNIFFNKNKEINKDHDCDYAIGISIISLPRNFDIVDNFLIKVASYIKSSVSTIGIATLDYGFNSYYYYFDKDRNIRKQIFQPNDSDKIIYERISK